MTPTELVKVSLHIAVPVLNAAGVLMLLMVSMSRLAAGTDEPDKETTDA